MSDIATLTEICRSAMCGPHQECDDQHPCSCRDAAKAIAAAGYARPAPAPSLWRTMESAPKNGRFIVLLKDGSIEVAKRLTQSATLVIGAAFSFDCAPATHWQPLPSLPQPSEG